MFDATCEYECMISSQAWGMFPPFFLLEELMLFFSENMMISSAKSLELDDHENWFQYLHPRFKSVRGHKFPWKNLWMLISFGLVCALLSFHTHNGPYLVSL